MLQKSIIIFILTLALYHTNYAQQEECPQFEWTEGIKYRYVESNTYGIIEKGEVKIDNLGNIFMLLSIDASINYHTESIEIFIADHTIPINYKDNELGSLIILKLDKNLNLLWYNKLYMMKDTVAYVLPHILFSGLQLDDKGNVYISGTAISLYSSVASLHCDNKSFVLDTRAKGRTMNCFLLKLNRTNGNAFWLKKLDGISPINIKMTTNDNLYMAFTTVKDTVKIDNNVYATTKDISGIARFNALGELQWIVWGSINHRYPYYFNASAHGFSISPQQYMDVDTLDNVYTFEFIDSTLTKIDSSGQVQWHRSYPLYSHHYYSNIHIDYSGKVNMIKHLGQHTGVPNPYDFGNGDTVTISEYGSYFLWQLDPVSGQTILVSRLWDHISDNTEVIPYHTTSDQYGNFYISGALRGKDSVQLGDTVYYVTQNSNAQTTSSYTPLDAFVAKVQLPAEGMGNAHFEWILRSEGTGMETANLAFSSLNGKEHYFYSNYSANLLYGTGVFGNHVLADTFTDTNNYVINRVSFYFGKINTDCSLPTEEITNPLQTVTIYPNPANTNITITNLPPNSTINITDITGRVLYTQYNKANSTVQLPVNGMGNGMYFVQIINGENRVNRKVVMQR